MASSNIYITPSTSLVLIKRYDRPTNVYLSTFNTPDFQVNVRDTTGSSTLQVTLSTIGGARFTDNTNSYQINQPYGFVNLSLRTSTLWQILHTSGQTPESSAANVQTTRLSTFFVDVMSTATKRVSSVTIENLNTPNSIQLIGPFIIGNLSTPGFIQLESTLNVYGNASFDKNIFVSGGMSTLSSFQVETLLALSSFVQGFSSFGVGGNLNVGRELFLQSTLHTQSTLQVDTLQVQKSTPIITMNLRDSVLAAGLFSIEKDLSVGGVLFLGGNLTIEQTVSSLSGGFSTGTLTVGGPLTLLGSVSSLSNATFASSMNLQSSLFVQTFFSSLSSMNVGQIVSTNQFQAYFLSSSTSFSTSGDFTILSTLTVNGSLSTNDVKIGQRNLLTVEGDLFVAQSVSSFGDTRLQTFSAKSASLNSLWVSTSVGVGGNLYGFESVTVKDALLSSIFVTENIEVVGQLNISSLGLSSNLRVRGNMSILGVADIKTFDVTSYGVSSLDIITSSPYIALRASTLNVKGTLNSDQVQLALNPASGTISFPAYGNLLANTLYAKQFDSFQFISPTVTTENILRVSSLVSPGSLPRFEIDQKTMFARGLSTVFVKTNTFESLSTFNGSFVGDGGNLDLVPLFFSTLSATTLVTNALTTDFFSTTLIGFGLQSPEFISLLEIDQSLVFNTPFQILSTSVPSQPLTIAPLSFSTLNIGNGLFLDSGTRRVGALISNPQYDFDISGSLYYTGNLYYSTMNQLNFYVEKPVLLLSTLRYASSILINNDAIAKSYIFYSTLKNLNSKPPALVLNESEQPINELTFVEPDNQTWASLTTSPMMSTLNLANQMFVYNQTKQVGINTLEYNYQNSNYTPSPIPSQYEFLVNGDSFLSTLYVSSITTTQILTSSFVTPTFGINPTEPSTLNVLSTSFFQENIGRPQIIVNNFVSLIKDEYLNGYCMVKSPLEGGLRFISTSVSSSVYFYVYNQAFVSSAKVDFLHAETVFCKTQVL